MKKNLVKLLFIPALLLVGCDKNNPQNQTLPDGSSIPSIPSTPEEAQNLAEGFFDGYSNGSAHSRIKALAEQNNGFSLSFRIYTKINNNVIIDNDLFLGRTGNVAWAEDTLYAMSPDPGNLPYTVKGAIKYTNETEDEYEVYYANNEDQYNYYASFYNEDIDLSVQELEDYFGLSDGLLVYLMTVTEAKIASFASNRKALYFSMSNINLNGQYAEYSNLDIAFDFETHFIMYYNYWYINTQTNEVNMTVFQVNAFNFGVTPPTLVKE